MKIKIAPSILAGDFACLEKDVAIVEKAGADLLHIDVMDGHFVPNITIGPMVVKALREKSRLPFDVHLMIENPEKYISEFAKAGSDIITIHIEASTDPVRDLKRIAGYGIKPGISLNPDTPVSKIVKVLGLVRTVLVMTVQPGFGGQGFMRPVLKKIRDLKRIIDEKKLKVDIEVDGGISTKTAGDVVSAGANILVAGVAIFHSGNPSTALKKLRSTALKTLQKAGR